MPTLNNNETNNISIFTDALEFTAEIYSKVKEPTKLALKDTVHLAAETVVMGVGTTAVITSHTRAAMEEINALLPKNEDEAKSLVNRNKQRFASLFDTDEDTNNTEKPRVRAAS